MGPKCNYGYATKDYEDQKYNLNKICLEYTETGRISCYALNVGIHLIFSGEIVYLLVCDNRYFCLLLFLKVSPLNVITE